MNNSLRTILAVVSGAIIASLVLFTVGFIANSIQPTPPELMDPATPEAVVQRVASTTTFTWLTTLFGLALGAFIGGMAGAKIASTKMVKVTRLIGLVLAIWAFYTFYIVYPDVLWVPIAMLFSVFIFSYLGGLAVIQFNLTG